MFLSIRNIYTEKLIMGGNIMSKKNDQKIKCHVESCKYQDCCDHCCTLKEIEVSCTCGANDATDKKETICKSFKCCE